MKRINLKLISICLVFLVLISNLSIPLQKVSASDFSNNELETFSMMLYAHAILGDDLTEITSRKQQSLKLAAVLDASSADTNPIEIRLHEVNAMCAESRQSIKNRYTGSELCVNLAITDQICSSEIKSLETALQRSRHGRGLQSFLRRGLRRLDPSRANIGKLMGFIRREVLPEAAKQIVRGFLGGGDVVIRSVIRQTFIRNARQVIKTNLSKDMMMSGVPTQIIQGIGLPAPDVFDFSKVQTSPNIDLQAIRQNCGEELGDKSQPEKQEVVSEVDPDLITPLLEKNSVQFNCKMPSWYYGTNFAVEGAPELFDLLVTLDLKYGSVTYIYDYEANWIGSWTYENRHHGEGKGDYTGAGWFSGTEQETIMWYQYGTIVGTGEIYTSDESQNIHTNNFLGAITDDLKRGVFCRIPVGYEGDIKSVGKEGLFSWNTDYCRPCTIDIN